MTVWEHLQTDPKKVANFMKTMAIMGARISTVGKYKFDWVLAEAEKAPERTVLVDVGGGNGHAIKAIAKAMPGLPVERCVLEDTEVVLEESKAGFEDSEIGRPEFIATDFHKEQPVRGKFTRQQTSLDLQPPDWPVKANFSFTLKAPSSTTSDAASTTTATKNASASSSTYATPWPRIADSSSWSRCSRTRPLRWLRRRISSWRRLAARSVRSKGSATLRARLGWQLERCICPRGLMCLLLSV